MFIYFKRRIQQSHLLSDTEILLSNHGSLRFQTYQEGAERVVDPPLGIVAGPTHEDPQNLFHWTATILGPDQTPYEGGTFTVDIFVPQDYPFQPPKVHFTTKVFHMNVRDDGLFWPSLFHADKWTSQCTIAKGLLEIQSLLAVPYPEDPLNPEQRDIYYANRPKYNETAKKWTQQYAM